MLIGECFAHKPHQIQPSTGANGAYRVTQHLNGKIAHQNTCAKCAFCTFHQLLFKRKTISQTALSPSRFVFPTDERIVVAHFFGFPCLGSECSPAQQHQSPPATAYHVNVKVCFAALCVRAHNPFDANYTVGVCRRKLQQDGARKTKRPSNL